MSVGMVMAQVATLESQGPQFELGTFDQEGPAILVVNKK